MYQLCRAKRFDKFGPHSAVRAQEVVQIGTLLELTSLLDLLQTVHRTDDGFTCIHTGWRRVLEAGTASRVRSPAARAGTTRSGRSWGSTPFATVTHI